MTIEPSAARNDGQGVNFSNVRRSVGGIRAKRGTSRAIIEETRRQVRNDQIKLSMSRQSVDQMEQQ